MTTLSNRNEAFLASWVARIQELEDAAWQLLDVMNVDDAEGDLLDKIGSKVGEDRRGRGDTEYRQAIRLRIRVNRSHGRTEDVIDVARLANVSGTPTYDEYYPAAFEVGAVSLEGGASVATAIGQARAAGTYGVLNFLPDASAALILDDAVGTLAESGELDDAVSTTSTAGYLSSGQVA